MRLNHSADYIMLSIVKGLWNIATLLLLVGCQQREPAISDADFREFRASWPGMTEQCLNENRYDGMAAFRPDDPDCFYMQKRQKWSGLWNYGWEWTAFCPYAEKDCDDSTKGANWLVFAPNSGPKSKIAAGLYRIDFVGRRTSVPGGYGHMSGYEHMIVVDRLISLKELEPPKRQVDPGSSPG